ncbi:MAG: ATP synthase subunit I [Candidatus Electrothrix sp. AR4]|nr:ATP synthase subunit I [Candidatus Electrothrix sp. AR4]
MTDPKNKAAQQHGEELVLLLLIERFNLFMVVLLTLGGWYFVSWHLAQSVLIGGALSCASFFLLKRNAVQIVNAFSAVGNPEQIAQQAKPQGFAGKFYARLALFTLLLGILGLTTSINIIGLVLGLSTVMLSIIIVTLTRGHMILLGKYVKGV